MRMRARGVFSCAQVRRTCSNRRKATRGAGVAVGAGEGVYVGVRVGVGDDALAVVKVALAREVAVARNVGVGVGVTTYTRSVTESAPMATASFARLRRCASGRNSWI